MTITGPALVANHPAVSITSGAGAFNIFSISGTGNLVVGISNLKLTGAVNAIKGSAISFADEYLTLTNMEIIGNRHDGLRGHRHTLQRRHCAKLTLLNSTVAGNSSGRSFGGGGIYLGNSATLVVTNSTISGNTASAGGGGLYEYNAGTVTITNSTIANNSAASGGGLRFKTSSSAPFGTVTLLDATISGNSAATGGGIYSSVPISLVLDNTIVSGNAAGTGPDIAASVAGTTVTTTYSAIGSFSGFAHTMGTGDLAEGINLSLASLADNLTGIPATSHSPNPADRGIEPRQCGAERGRPDQFALPGANVDERGVSRTSTSNPATNPPDIGA